jgi:hypothetical protein
MGGERRAVLWRAGRSAFKGDRSGMRPYLVIKSTFSLSKNGTAVAGARSGSVKISKKVTETALQRLQRFLGSR